MEFPVHTIGTAPEQSKRLLVGAQQKYGFVPNLLATLADEPAALEAYMTLAGLFEKSSLAVAEQQLVLLAISQANGCEYCLAAHSVIAKMNGVTQRLIDATVAGQATGDDRLDALLSYTREVTETRAYPKPENTERLLQAGFTTSQILAVLLGITMKTLSNYVNHIAKTQLDPQFLAK